MTKTIEVPLNISQIEDVVAAHLHALKAVPDDVEITGIVFGQTIDDNGVIKLTLETKEV